MNTNQPGLHGRECTPRKFVSVREIPAFNFFHPRPSVPISG